MTGTARQKLGDLVRCVSGGTPSRKVPGYFAGDIPWITGADIGPDGSATAREHITTDAIRASAAQVVPAGTVLLVTRTSVGKVGCAGTPLAFSQDVTALLHDPSRLETRYLIHFLRSKQSVLAAQARGATIRGVTREVVAALEVPLPPLEEQRRIAAILDRSDALRAKRREVAAQLEALTHSVFYEMFGDPARNERSWPTLSLQELATKFSDGPFGSNLKSEHYVYAGVRVVRLQNIGVGRFVNDDAAYIALDHFAKLKKHECRPGDVLIGTLGDPNLRACLLPESVAVALNKADCVQMRVDRGIALPEYVCALLNQPGTMALARSLILGQTRSRISMGRLRGLVVPVPPIERQALFAERVQQIEDIRSGLLKGLALDESLFVALQDRAFKGEL